MNHPKLLLIAFGALALDTAGAQVTSGADVTDDQIIVEGEKAPWDPAAEKQKKVCKRSTATGSIMPKVTCRTKGEWDMLTERSKVNVEKLKAERVTREHVRLIKDGN